jgi:hypothetical protein
VQQVPSPDRQTVTNAAGRHDGQFGVGQLDPGGGGRRPAMQRVVAAPRLRETPAVAYDGVPVSPPTAVPRGVIARVTPFPNANHAYPPEAGGALPAGAPLPPASSPSRRPKPSSSPSKRAATRTSPSRASPRSPARTGSSSSTPWSKPASSAPRRLPASWRPSPQSQPRNLAPAGNNPAHTRDYIQGIAPDEDRWYVAFTTPVRRHFSRLRRTTGSLQDRAAKPSALPDSVV